MESSTVAGCSNFPVGHMYDSVSSAVYRYFYSHINSHDREYSTQADIRGRLVVNNSSKQAKNKKCIIREFEFGESRFRFRNSIELLFKFEEGYYSTHFKPLDIYITEETFEEALNSFYEEVDMLWREYVLEDENVLSVDAKKLKESIKNVIEEVI